MTTPKDRTKPAERKPSTAHDFLLDPLPVPDASESNTDTAWGLWEHTLKSLEDGDQPTQAADLQDFPETEQAQLIPLLDQKP